MELVDYHHEEQREVWELNLSQYHRIQGSIKYVWLSSRGERHVGEINSRFTRRHLDSAREKYIARNLKWERI